MIEFNSTIKNGLPVLIKITGYTAPEDATRDCPGAQEEVEFTICWPNGAPLTGKLLASAEKDWCRLHDEAINAVHDYSQEVELERHLEMEAGRYDY